MSNPITVAEASVLTAHRRRVGRVVVMLSGAALVVTIWITAAIFIFPAMRSDLNGTLLTETIPLTCLSPRQAADIIDPYVRTRGSLYFIPTSGISAITVRGSQAQLNKSKDLIREFETDRNAACRVSPADLARRQAGIQDQLGRAAHGNAEPVIAGDKIPTAPKKQ
jgi:hypothetical protein